MNDILDAPPHIFVGLSGPAGSGKTSTADAIRPMAVVAPTGGDSIVWDHLFCAMPLYELASIRLKTLGEDQTSRQLYQIHDVLLDLFGRTLPYDTLVELAYDIVSEPIRDDGGKPRSFLQRVGTDMLRKYDSQVFSRWVLKTAKAHYRAALLEHPNMTAYVTMVSDVRFMDEALMIKNNPNSILIRFEASEQTLFERLYSRDGFVLDGAEATHESEEASKTPEFLALVDMFLDTDDLTIPQQAECVKIVVSEHINQLKVGV